MKRADGTSRCFVGRRKELPGRMQPYKLSELSVWQDHRGMTT
jgi:hypothetical protein